MTPTERMRRHRLRAKQGKRIIRLAVTADDEEALVALGLLNSASTDSPEAIAQAIEKLLASLNSCYE